MWQVMCLSKHPRQHWVNAVYTKRDINRHVVEDYTTRQILSDYISDLLDSIIISDFSFTLHQHIVWKYVGPDLHVYEFISWLPRFWRPNLSMTIDIHTHFSLVVQSQNFSYLFDCAGKFWDITRSVQLYEPARFRWKFWEYMKIFSVHKKF